MAGTRFTHDRTAFVKEDDIMTEPLIAPRGHTAAARVRASGRRRTVAVFSAAGVALLALGPLTASPAAAATGVLANPGFESGLDGWTSDGPEGAAKTETGGTSGLRLTHWLESEGSVATTQTVSGLADGWWTFGVDVTSGGGLASSAITTSGCGLDGETTVPSTESDGAWLRLEVSAYVSGGSCTVGLRTAGPAGSWASIDGATLEAGRSERTLRGADLSNVAKNEDRGATYADADGNAVDPIDALAGAGANVGRLKVWVDPADGYNDTDDVVASARRIVDAGMELLVDFHYSDRWTDPGAQGMPSAWVGLDAAAVTERVSEHTTEVLESLAAVGITADYVQVGNEINPGMLWPLGQTWDVDPTDDVSEPQWDALAGFLTAGAEAVKAVDPDTQVILHLTNINNGIDGLTWWFDEVVARDVPFDLIGLSYYGYWHGSLADLQGAVSTLSERYDRDVLVVETAYPWTLDDQPGLGWENVIDLESELVAGYPATPEGQAANLRAVQDVVASAPGGRGLGVVYWEPAWTAVEGNGWDPEDPASGNAWENQAVFDHDGRMLPAAAQFGETAYTVSAAPSVSLVGEAGVDGWFRSAVSVSAAISLPGLAVDAPLELSIDGGPAVPASDATVVDEDGEHSADAGVAAPGLVAVTRDAASAGAPLAPAPSLGEAVPAGPAADVAALAASTTTFGVDRTAPSVTATLDAEGARVTVGADDGLSGIATVEYAVDGGAAASYTGPIDVSALAAAGGGTITASATDRAGNVTESTVAVPAAIGTAPSDPDGSDDPSVSAPDDASAPDGLAVTGASGAALLSLIAAALLAIGVLGIGSRVLRRRRSADS
ncbi:arabinogalactan endo-1,4-beta-galactosidase [Labedella gwakjiensis]|uniref:Arabinogalactan endo-beta-1,4-galactanase n=2 Tax=Labedella gwakjiensis TaxID=390269 RepID=A0A2P8GZD6_9MICO|nr:arabinogalactan endo-1,4-beta-galactosidase [Labedella gwakjiensis]